PLRGHGHLDGYRLARGERPGDGGSVGAAGKRWSPGTRRVRLLRQRSLSEGPETSRAPDRFPVQPCRRAVTLRDRQPAVTAYPRAGGGDDQPLSQDSLPVPSGQPPRQPVDVHDVPGTAQSFAERLLVA